jgi:hypothetical protein
MPISISIRRAIVEGGSRAAAARGLVGGLWLLNLLVAGAVAVPFAESLQASIGGSLIHEKLRTGFDMGWYGELQGTARGLLATFSPAVMGAGAFLNNLEAWVSGDLWQAPPVVVTLGAAYLLLWTLLNGGILDRLCGRHEIGARLTLSAFLASSGRFFWRFLQLALMAGVLYLGIYLLGRRLFVYVEDATRDVTVEKVVLLATAAGTAAIAFLLCLVNVAFDYARIATVVEGRRDMLRTAGRGFAFVLRRPFRTLGLYFTLAVVGLLLLAGYSQIAPGARQATIPGIVLAFALGQIYLVAKLVLRLTFAGSQLALFESLHPVAALETPPPLPPGP